MTSEILYGILKHIASLDQSLGVQKHLEAIRDSLENLVSNPAQPSHQANLASALAAFTDAAGKMVESITASQAALIKQMGGEDYCDPAIIGKVTESIQKNAMTPTVARDFVKDLAARRAVFLETVRSARQSLEKLKISDTGLRPGTADVAFLVPRDIFDDELLAFSKELRFIGRLIQDVSEAKTGKAEPVILGQLSSSTPTITLLAALPALLILGNVIDKFLEAWERIEKIRQMRAQLEKMGLKSKTALQELTEEITTTVEEVVEESTSLVMLDYKGNRGDLGNAVRLDLRRLFGQIERGLTVEFRAAPESGDGEKQQVLQQIADVAKKLEFPEMVGEPLLLNKGEVLEDADGDISIVRTQRKVTTKKTTISKKQPHEDGKEE